MRKLLATGLQGIPLVTVLKTLESILLMKYPTPPLARLFPFPGSRHPPQQIDIALHTSAIAQFPEDAYGTVLASAPAYPSTLPLSPPSFSSFPPSSHLFSPLLSPSTSIPFPIPADSQPGGSEATFVGVGRYPFRGF
ncbi:hypothetical protein K435DRAFT_858271 [Dendrothele bispora CBS 962.96]|uniref:Uncharacterized protein n=1 Tax=Dendrothele bispora (strain CBS 962.96) TaxID=1314807 RepID=A0A4S8M3H7_DENBC|nr:hypothetical protein K435DRAFT_858271 [Dendrothele bispora CBS 962.96]